MLEQVREQISQGVTEHNAVVETGKKTINKVFPGWCVESLNQIPLDSIDKVMSNLGNTILFQSHRLIIYINYYIIINNY